MIEWAMREFLRVAVVAVSVLTAYFSYVYWSRPEAYQARVRDAELLMGLLNEYRAAKGTYPVLPGVDVPIAELIAALATSGVGFRSGMRLRDLDRDARYVSNNGESYGLLYHISQFGNPVTCLVEVGAHHSGWWKQPPSCRW